MRWLSLLLGLSAGLVGCTAETPGTSIPDPPPAPTTPPKSPPPTAPLACGEPLPSSPLALLTRRQYDNTIADLLGDTSSPASAFPPENQVQGFNNFTAAHQASPLSVEKYLEAAEALAARAVSTRLAELAPCADQNNAVSCGRDFVRGFGLRAFRRPLSATEAQLFDSLFTGAFATAGYARAVELVLGALLQSPQFLYRVDTQRAPAAETGAIAIGPYELASRLSYFLTGSMPDAELFAAAERRQLATDAEIEVQARRLLQKPRARETVRVFHHQWLGLDTLPQVSRELSGTGSGTQQLGSDWLASFDRFIDHVYWDTGNLGTLFSSKRVYLSPRLAPLYGVPPHPAGDMAAAELADRSGLLTQPALLAQLAHGDQSAPVLRGVFVRERLLCLPVPPPPPTVNVVPPDPNPNATTRERFRVHTEQPACSGCHLLFDGIGFGFEGYDQIGRYRTTENGLPVDTRGEVLGTGDVALDGSFDGIVELSARLAGSSRVRDCVATNWYRYAFGRIEGEADACSLDAVKKQFADSSGSLHELLVAITQSVAFRYREALVEPTQ